MYDLPLKKSSLDVVINEDVTIVMGTLNDDETLDLMTRMKVQGDNEVEIDFALMMEIFGKKLLGANITIGGEAFDPNNDEHRGSVPAMWKITAASQVVTYAVALPQQMVGNSEVPPQP